ncbi:TetR family transcriptional regulator [Porphyromonas cangingivalis]|uniref:TetR family transcriptional regulator n=1 Tax=Porphyromonas cangingivalis TaxID=36874 RepID=A0A0A2EYB8_PORCN|nr:TetR/AcrR family transcriptional regulator [Porphyromonas cangingivalis]KGN81299.1 TetR family transcriptional regulator [Porphyromonas cangingivalis]
MSKQVDNTAQQSTEQRIKNAARKVFHAKGFAATRTRDIAEEAGVNLALLNYYFKNKQKLFDIVMAETMYDFLHIVSSTLNNEELSFEQRIENFASLYIDKLIEEPLIAQFILSDLHNSSKPSILPSKIKEIVTRSGVVQLYNQKMIERGQTPINVLHVLVNVIGLAVFPFMGKPILKGVGGIDDSEFKELMLERKKLIPIWINAMFF